MPSKSKAQHNLMAMVANDPKAAKRLGIPQSVGRDYVKADKGRKFGDSDMYKKGADRMAHRGKTKGKMVKMAEGGSVYRKAADGVAHKGKTKAKMVKMRYGGEC